MKNAWLFWWAVAAILAICIVACAWWMVLTVIQLRALPGDDMTIPTRIENPPAVLQWDCGNSSIMNSVSNPDPTRCVPHQPKG